MNWDNIYYICMALGAVILAILSVEDIRERKISIVIPAIYSVLVCAVKGYDMLAVTLAGMLPGLVICIMSFFMKGQIGLGDGLLIVFIGAVLGGDDSLKVFMLSFVFVFIFSCIGLAAKRLSKKTVLPFVPFYFAAYLGVVYL